MTTIDRYVLSLFVKVLIVCFVSIGGLFVVVDAFSNLDEFVELGRKHANASAVVLNFYSARMLSLFDFASGILVLVAGMFTVTWLQRTNELTAMMAAGVPKARVVLPLIAASVVVSLTGAANREFLIPRFRRQLSRGWQELVGAELEPMRPKYDNRTNILFDGRHVQPDQRRIAQPMIRLPVAMPGVGKQLSAESAQYLPAEEDRPAGYLLLNVKQQELLLKSPSLQMDDQPIVMTPHDTPWLRPDQAFIASGLTFTHLTADKAWRQWSSSRQLVAALRNPSVDFGADVRVAVHLRLVKPLLDLTLLFLGLPLVLTSRSRSVFVAAGFCFLLVTAFYVVVVSCQGLGSNYLISPALAAWFPVLVFTPIAYANSVALWT